MSHIGVMSLLLSNGRGVLIDTDDFERLVVRRWHRDKQGYARSGGGHQQVLMHRFLLNPGSGVQVDHINGDRADNRRSNLRHASNRQNQQNKRPLPGTSRYKGVSLCRRRGRWQANIKIDGKGTYLGSFLREEEAARAYNAAASEAFGPFARLNVIEDDVSDYDIEQTVLRELLEQIGKERYGSKWISKLSTDLGYSVPGLFRVVSGESPITQRLKRRLRDQVKP